MGKHIEAVGEGDAAYYAARCAALAAWWDRVREEAEARRAALYAHYVAAPENSEARFLLSHQLAELDEFVTNGEPDPHYVFAPGSRVNPLLEATA